MKVVNILGTDYEIHFVDEFPEYLQEVGELNDPLKMVYCSIKNGNIPLNEARQYMRIERR